MNNDSAKLPDSPANAPAAPNESSGINIRAFVKIYDPESDEVFVINNDS